MNQGTTGTSAATYQDGVKAESIGDLRRLIGLYQEREARVYGVLERAVEAGEALRDALIDPSQDRASALEAWRDAAYGASCL